jgi:molecular chaperone DnaK (HSP70)
MKLGVDFGTTRIVVAAVDRGNYPVVSFDTHEGGSAEWYPPLIAVKGGERCYGWEAYGCQGDPEWTVVRSLKRILEQAGPNTLVEIEGQTLGLMELLTGLTCSLAQALRRQSSLDVKKDELLEVVLGVPANANSNQRFLTAEAFGAAGFSVIGVLNEPSAASVEFGHRNKSLEDGQLLLVYDLGGGTFDVSLVRQDERTHVVVASEGISTLGGDDFDQELAEMALEAAGVEEDLTQGEWFRLLEECRQKKEALHPNTRKIAIDLENVREGLPGVTIPAADYYIRCQEQAGKTLQAVQDLLEKHGNPDIEWLYVTGGGSEMPVISRVLREEFGRRVKRSAYTRSATAIGLAIQADHSSGYELRDRFTRYFGVWREAEGGQRIIFDPLFEKGVELPSADETSMEITRLYRAAHNIGHFRYLECSHLHDDQPAGDITIWDEILFPLDPSLAGEDDLARVTVMHSADAEGQMIEESYRCDHRGMVVVRITNRTSGYERSFPLGRWSVKTKPVNPVRKRRGTRSQS